MAADLLTALERIETGAREIREREEQLAEDIRQASDLGASQRQIASWAGMSPATVNRRLRRPQLSPEETEHVAEWKIEMRKAELGLAKVRLAEAEIAHGRESSLDPAEIDELIEEALQIVEEIDDLDL